MCEWYPTLQMWSRIIVHILRHRTTASLFPLITYDVFLCLVFLLISPRISRLLNNRVSTSFLLHIPPSFLLLRKMVSCWLQEQTLPLRSQPLSTMPPQVFAPVSSNGVPSILQDIHPLSQIMYSGLLRPKKRHTLVCSPH